MKYARIIDSTVAEVFVPPSGFTLADCLHSSLVAQFEQCPEYVEQCWIKNADGSFSEPLPLPSLEPPAADLPA